ncbi:MAG: DUF2993 domain-containing protein [Cyanobacteria bacterium P01_F01_bin.150]
MLTSLLDLKNGRGGDLGERMLNTVASQAIRHLFTSSESVEVNISCEPSSKLLQGSIDSFKMKGNGLVIRSAFQVAEMVFQTDVVSIDTSALLSGQLRLKMPTQAIAQVVLTEDAINKAFEAELVQQRLQRVELESLTGLSGGEPVTFESVKVQLHANNGVTITALTDLPNKKAVPIGIKAILAVEKRRRIMFKDAQFTGDQVPPELQATSRILSEGLITVLNGMVDLDRFDLDGVSMRVNRLETQDKTLVFSGYAQIAYFPGNG